MSSRDQFVFHADTPLTKFEVYGGRAEHNAHDRNGLHVEFPNGCTVSVQWGYGSYCASRDMFARNWTKPSGPSPDAEVACWNTPNGGLLSFGEDCVKGWCSWDEVKELLELASKGELTEPIRIGKDETDE